jgi:hypothetical protein
MLALHPALFLDITDQCSRRYMSSHGTGACMGGGCKQAGPSRLTGAVPCVILNPSFGKALPNLCYVWPSLLLLPVSDPLALDRHRCCSFCVQPLMFVTCAATLLTPLYLWIFIGRCADACGLAGMNLHGCHCDS